MTISDVWPTRWKIWHETKVNYCDFTVFIVMLHSHFYNVDPLLFVMTDKNCSVGSFFSFWRGAGLRTKLLQYSKYL